MYVKENKAKSIIVCGTIGGQFMAGLSGGQRKLLLFQLIFQRISTQKNLLVVLDEPFAGVTDDFVPYIMERLNMMSIEHNILLVTNDHVETLKNLADNTVTVCAIDRSTVKVNGKEGVDRELALLAMSIGDEYSPTTNDQQDMKFFRAVEFSKFGGLFHCAAFAVCAFGLFVATYWDSQPGSEMLVLVAGGLVSFFVLFPYFLQIVDWRIFMLEEAEALLHTSRSMNKFLKASLITFLLFFVAALQFWCTDAVLGTISTWQYYVAISFDTFACMVPIIVFGLYTNLPDEMVQMVGVVPFLLMIFFSTTFSPGAGIDGLKWLRYAFPRFYLWCMLPGVDVLMEGCPASEKWTLIYLVLSSMLVPYLFGLFAVVREMTQAYGSLKKQSSRHGIMMSAEYMELQLELFGEKTLKCLKHEGSGSEQDATKLI